MPLGKVYYDSKHAKGLSSIEKLVMAGKSNKSDVKEWFFGSENVHFA